MYSKKIFFKLCLFAGLIFIAVGIIMNILEISSSGMTYSKRGASWGTLTGSGVFTIAFVMLALSGISYLLYTTDLEERERRKSSDQEKPVRIWKNKTTQKKRKRKK